MRGGEAQVSANVFAQKKSDRCLPHLANANARQVTGDHPYNSYWNLGEHQLTNFHACGLRGRTRPANTRVIDFW